MLRENLILPIFHRLGRSPPQAAEAGGLFLWRRFPDAHDPPADVSAGAT